MFLPVLTTRRAVPRPAVWRGRPDSVLRPAPGVPPVTWGTERSSDGHRPGRQCPVRPHCYYRTLFLSGMHAVWGCFKMWGVYLRAVMGKITVKSQTETMVAMIGQWRIQVSSFCRRGFCHMPRVRSFFFSRFAFHSSCYLIYFVVGQDCKT